LKELLIDGDILLYQYGCTNESRIEWGEGITSEWSDFEQAKSELDSFLVSLMLQTSTKKLLIAFSSIEPPSFRYKVLPTYKHNRQNKEKPKLYYDLRNYMLENYPCKTKPGLEGDDILGIEATLYPGKYIICSTDKDMKQIPGEHYNWRIKKRFKVSEEEADRWFYTQIFTGDSTDGYLGCPGIGPVKANNYLNSIKHDFLKNGWDCISAWYRVKGLTEQDALTQARVARILRKEDYDFEREEIKLWNPKVD
jgi:5'-3' exonuclease